ncbi:MAG: response regulator [Proteobacteria bacterium]|nr:response regulator [Pseudomonadota bacterium]MBU1138690.1 response regulator [Pseudomonadota bacterium]MBU1233977.1 response regulator [Pseudomonadota bacterium]MBU1419682.1 response regulator [Pseudomonadota bacterium]MBU1454138.1 response regulator [Pseudomonadota bacterium]
MPTEQTSILILDDEPIVSKRLKPSLEKKGYEVETFTTSADALARINERQFNIVVTDLKMEGMDGMQFLSEVKKKYPATEVIVITGFATMATAKESFNKGVFDFLAKPFKLGEIAEVISKAETKIKNSPK